MVFILPRPDPRMDLGLLGVLWVRSTEDEVALLDQALFSGGGRLVFLQVDKAFRAVDPIGVEPAYASAPPGACHRCVRGPSQSMRTHIERQIQLAM